MTTTTINNISKYNLVLCELWHKEFDGFDENSDVNICGHYLVINKFDSNIFDYDSSDDNEDNTPLTDEEFYDDEGLNNFDTLDDMVQLYRAKYVFINSSLPDYKKKHPLIRNFKNIIEREDYIQPHIAECITLSGDELVCIIKTFWIKIIQRKWKKIYKERKDALLKRRNINSLNHRNITGKWSNDYYIPSLHGMLQELKY